MSSVSPTSKGCPSIMDGVFVELPPIVHGLPAWWVRNELFYQLIFSFFFFPLNSFLSKIQHQMWYLHIGSSTSRQWSLCSSLTLSKFPSWFQSQMNVLTTKRNCNADTLGLEPDEWGGCTGYDEPYEKAIMRGSWLGKRHVTSRKQMLMPRELLRKQGRIIYRLPTQRRIWLY